jgi:hypothetical protein
MGCFRILYYVNRGFFKIKEITLKIMEKGEA